MQCCALLSQQSLKQFERLGSGQLNWITRVFVEFAIKYFFLKYSRLVVYDQSLDWLKNLYGNILREEMVLFVKEHFPSHLFKNQVTRVHHKSTEEYFNAISLQKLIIHIPFSVY